MANFNALPYEIKRLIFQHIDSTKQLGECRRVCKMWDEPAECAMFSKQLYITASNTRSLYMHLLNKPSKANLIKHIQLADQPFTESTVPLLQLAITPSIEKIIAWADSPIDERFYQTLTQMVRDSGVRLPRLKNIPWPGRYFADTHHQTALSLRDSLEGMVIPPNSGDRPHEISQHLGEFKRLSKLYVNCIFDTLPQVESIFCGIGSLMKVELNNCFFDQENIWPHEERLQWMKQHVVINGNAIGLRAKDDLSLSIPLIEYFLYKYPNIRKLVYEATVEDQERNEEIEFNRQVCSWISKIPNYTMTLNTHFGWREHYELFAGHKNVFRLHYGHVYEPVTEFEQEISSTMGQDGNRTTRFHFSTESPLDEVDFDTHIALLQDIGTFTTHVHMRFAYPGHGIDSTNWMESKLLFKALEVMNHLEGMKVSLSTNDLKSIELDLPAQYSKRHFNTLEISGAQIEPAMFRTLDRFFHTIRTMKLSCCPIEKDQTDTVCIHMSSTAIGKLILNTESDLSELIEFSQDHQDMIVLKHDTYLMINLHQRVTSYIRLEPHSSHVHQISPADYSSRPQHANSFSISCHLLASIELDLGEIHAIIDVQKYCDTLDAASTQLRV